MQILIFGDSITQSLWDKHGGWADRLKSYIQSNEVKNGIKNYHEVYNLGVDGNTTKQLIERFENEVKTRLWEDEQYAFIFDIGLIDTLHRNSTDFESTPEEYKKELTTITHLAEKYGDIICFLDITPVEEKLTNPLKFSSTGKCYTNNRINDFNKVLQQHCIDNKIECIHINKCFMQSPDYTKLLIDGAHPNSEGHKLISETVLPYVVDWLKN